MSELEVPTHSSSLPPVELWVLSRNRPDYLLEMLASLEKQTYKNHKIIVSDNSSDNCVLDVIRDLPYIDIKIRRPPLSSLDHFSTVLAETTSPYFMMLHDDDLALPNMVEDLVGLLQENPNASAAVGNAFVIHGDNRTEDLLVQDDSGLRTLTSVQKLAEDYLENEQRVFPFPAYLYRADFAKRAATSIREGRKASDVTFLCRLLQLGPFLRTQHPVLCYRIHPDQDTQAMSFQDQGALQKWFIRNRILTRGNSILTYSRLRHLSRARSTPHRRKLLVAKTLGLFATHPRLALKFIRNKLRHGAR